MYSSFDFGKPNIFNNTKANLLKRKPVNINTQININIQFVPRKLIMRNSHRYILRKTAINNKFDWLTKYLTSISPKIEAPFKVQTRRLRRKPDMHPIKTQPDQYTKFQYGLICGNSNATKNIDQQLNHSRTELYAFQDQNRRIGNKGPNLSILCEANQQTNNRKTDLRQSYNSVEVNQMKMKKYQTSNHFRNKIKQKTINMRKQMQTKLNSSQKQVDGLKQQCKVLGKRNGNEYRQKHSSFQIKEDFELKPWNIPRDQNEQLQMKQNLRNASIRPYKSNFQTSYQLSQSFS